MRYKNMPPEERRDITLMRLAGVGESYLKARYPISAATIRKKIVPDTIESGDALVAYFAENWKAGHPHNNAAHLYLAKLDGRGIRNLELVTAAEHRAYQAVAEVLFHPREDALSRDTRIEEISGERTRSPQTLADKILGYHERTVLRFVLPRLRQAFDSGIVRIDEVFQLARSDIFSAYRDGLQIRSDTDLSSAIDSAWTNHDNSLKRTLQEPLDTLLAAEREVIKRRYGFFGEPETMAAVSRAMRLPIEEVRRYEARALLKLTNPLRRRMLEKKRASGS